MGVLCGTTANTMKAIFVYHFYSVWRSHNKVSSTTHRLPLVCRLWHNTTPTCSSRKRTFSVLLFFFFLSWAASVERFRQMVPQIAMVTVSSGSQIAPTPAKEPLAKALVSPCWTDAFARGSKMPALPFGHLADAFNQAPDFRGLSLKGNRRAWIFSIIS